MLKKLLSGIACSAILVTNASSLNIVVSNDDSYETANVQQLKVALENAGHSVIISVPCAHQSGKGGSLGSYFKNVPIHKLSADSNGVLTIDDTNGTAGYCVGNLESEKDTLTFNEFIDATPIHAVAHGIYKANETTKWSKNPDLVISGPNEGRNIGFAVHISGTLGAAHTAIVNGIPAIAVSAGSTPSDASEAEIYAKLVASKVVDIVSKLEATKKSGEALLPEKMGLNVNLPDAGVLDSDTDYKFTEVNWAFGSSLKYGTYAAYGVTDIGLIFGADSSGDTDPNSEGIASTEYVTISTIDATENAPKAKSAHTAYRLNELVK